MMEPEQKSFYDFVNSYISEFITQNIDSLKDSNLYRQMLAQFERSLFNSIMTATKGNQSEAASVLGLNRATLRKKIKNLSVNHNGQN